MNLRSGADAFFSFLASLYLVLFAAEALVVLISSVFPIFVVALALTAFANGLWMTVGGFMVSPEILNVFWKYTFYQIDYQRYAFSLLVRNQFIGSVFECDAGCQCQYVTSLVDQCKINGGEVVEQLGFLTPNGLSYVCCFSILS
jgi:ABC-2 type transporter